MRRPFLKAGIPLFCFILAIVYEPHPLLGQTQEEIRVLAMFYKEKDLVVTPTRHPKPISQVAENITVVTAKEIEGMNAHTVAEVLNRIPGLFVNFNQDFGATSLLLIQGSEQRHVLVLLDGIPWNFLSDEAAETNSIPIGIIDRIEIVKGPASSAWGSSLGGVINILTKPAGDGKKPMGALKASYGERETMDLSAQVSGTAGSVGYYLFGGRQDSDGLRSGRYFDTNNLYSKLRIQLSENVEAGVTMGFSQPNVKLGDFGGEDITSTFIGRTSFMTASLDAFLSSDLSLNLSFHRFKQEHISTNRALGQGIVGTPGELYLENVFDEETLGGRGKLILDTGVHTAVFGVDFDRGEMDQTLNAGPLLQLYGVAPSSSTHPEIDRWAVYANDTIVIDQCSLTPGIRYDRNSVTGAFLSPSLGVTYRLDDHSVLRASVARGFTIPPLVSSSGGGLFLNPNPALEPEKVWSYQVGAESGLLKYLWVKTTVFLHDLDKALKRELFAAGPPTFNDLVLNAGKIRRKGLEVELETLPVHNFSLLAGYAYVNIEPPNDTGCEEAYSWNMGIRYNDRESFRAELFGHYIWWDLDSRYRGSYDHFIWDLNLRKSIRLRGEAAPEIFFTAHNIFNGDQYLFDDHKNPERWIEAGIRAKF